MRNFRPGRARAFLAMMLGMAPAATAHGQDFAIADRIVDEYRLDAHLPGIVYGIVENGRLVHMRAFGVRSLESGQAPAGDTIFRIASMTKAFTALTILKLRDDGKLDLDASAADYVPEMRGWKYPTADSRPVRVRDLLNHTSGLVTDDPWGDRQTSLPEPDFTKLLGEGVPFTAAPGTRYEYSNLGYAILGRIITNVSGQPFETTIGRTLLEPLGMVDSGFVAEDAPIERRAPGYRWEDNGWKPEPVLGPGAFGAMGGLQTTVNDFTKWVTFLLSAWPARDAPDHGPVKRATVRELLQGSNFPRLRGSGSARQAVAYGMGLAVAVDDALGLTASHSGGYPGYGSHVLLLPDRGVGIFAFANRTYAGPSIAVWDAAAALNAAKRLGKERGLAASAELEAAYRAAGTMYAAGDVAAAGDMLAMNFLLDHGAEVWSKRLAELRVEVGDCETAAPVEATGALTGEFEWRCERGRVEGSLTLAPTRPALIQKWDVQRVEP